MTFSTRDGVTRCDRCRAVITHTTWRDLATHVCPRTPPKEPK